ncbi:hypothetical protein I4U23_003098 [Adineta vaga]|nr:hypothetical protein I4U23_003098 [Adineta vaga]
MTNPKGYRRGTRHLFARDFKKNGRIPLATYMKIYKRGDIVDIKGNGAVQKGMPHRYYHGKTGRVFNVTRHAVGIIVNKRVRHRIIAKRINVRIEHIKHSKCRSDFLNRVKLSEKLKRAAKESGKPVPLSSIKRQPQGPRKQHLIDMACRPFIKNGSRLLRPILYSRTIVNGTQDKPPFPKVLPVGLPLQNELPEVQYVPDTPPNQQNYPNMSRRLLQCRGVETVHDKLIHKQYGIMALAPGLMKENHFNSIRDMINKRIDMERCFSIWRVDPPWHPWYFKGLNKKRGAGKGSIDYFVTPIKANRMIIEVGGTLSFDYLYRTLLTKLKFYHFQQYLFHKNY